jgi:hypothetical protein
VATAALVETWTSLGGWASTWEPQEWGRPPPAPAGASKDQFPHLIGIERMLLAETAPTWNEPLGEHVKNDLGASP